MGVENILLGKGVILPVKYFVRKHLEYFKKNYDDELIMGELIKKFSQLVENK